MQAIGTYADCRDNADCTEMADCTPGGRIVRDIILLARSRRISKDLNATSTDPKCHFGSRLQEVAQEIRSLA